MVHRNDILYVFGGIGGTAGEEEVMDDMYELNLSKFKSLLF